MLNTNESTTIFILQIFFKSKQGLITNQTRVLLSAKSTFIRRLMSGFCLLVDVQEWQEALTVVCHLSTQVYVVQNSSLRVNANATTGTAPHQATRRCVKCERSVSSSQRGPLLLLRRRRRVNSPTLMGAALPVQAQASIH